MFRLILNFLGCVFLASNISTRYIGEKCTVKSTGKEGICTELRNCQDDMQFDIPYCEVTSNPKRICCLRPKPLKSNFQTHSYENNHQGDNCTLKSTGQKGVCTELKNCQDDLYFSMSNCGSSNGFQKICCVNPKVTESLSERMPGEISRQKCEEYSKYTNNNCFIDTNITSLNWTKILYPDNQPHIAIIQTDQNNFERYCTGTIISEKYVLSDANCFDIENRRPNMVLMNYLDQTNMQTFKIKKVIIHPNYEKYSIHHNVALIELDGSISFNNYVRPGCLSDKFMDNSENVMAVTLRFPFFESGKYLVKEATKLVPHEICAEQYSDWNYEEILQPDKQICIQPPKALCARLTGGPLQIYDKKYPCRYQIVGISSYRLFCNNFVEIYTRVSAYLKWIEDIVWPQ